MGVLEVILGVHSAIKIASNSVNPHCRIRSTAGGDAVLRNVAIMFE
jgi:hypothetical protein